MVSVVSEASQDDRQHVLEYVYVFEIIKGMQAYAHVS